MLTPPANVAPSGRRPYGTTAFPRDSVSHVFANAISAGDVPASTNTPAACMSYCAKLGYSMSGVEYRSECYCGNTWTNSAPPADIPASSCNMPCSGAPGTTCGGFWAIQIYVSG
ncbi:WSC domain-containing protein [Mycena vulgaris]|nr:WSC domain-containing protein [Mycena vulgaris]